MTHSIVRARNFLSAWWLALKVFGRNSLGRRFEREVPYLRYVIGPEDVCLHVGASDGRHSYVMSHLAPRGAVWAFEPARYGLTVLRHVLALHRLANVRAFNVAVSDEEGDIELVTPIKINGREGRSFAFIAAQAAGVARADITSRGQIAQRTRAIVIDWFCAAQGIARVDFIRCDVEGAEVKVLAGAREVIARDRPSLLVELHPILLRSMFASSAEAVRDGLLAQGYRMFRVEHGALVADTGILPGAWADYFFVHPQRASRLPAGPFRDALAAAAG